MEWVSHRAIFYKFWLVLLAVFLYRIRTDNFLKLSSFTHPHPPKNPPGHRTTSIYCISGQKLQLDLTFNSWFSNIHWYYRIHVVTFPYLSELPPNMNESNECRINSQWWLLSRSKHDYGLLNAPGLRSFKDIVNLDTVRRFIVCRSRGNTIPGFICCIFIFTPTTSSRRARSLGWACNGEMTKGGRGQGGKKRKMLVIVLSYNGVIVCGVIKDMCSLFS